MTDTSDKPQKGTGTKIQIPGTKDTDSFTESVERFVEAATWVSDIDSVQVAIMRRVAEELDTNGVQAALVNQLGVAARTVLKNKHSEASFDEDEDFLNGE